MQKKFLILKKKKKKKNIIFFFPKKKKKKKKKWDMEPIILVWIGEPTCERLTVTLPKFQKTNSKTD